MTGIDFHQIFEALPGPILVLRPDENFTVVGASEAYFKATHTVREHLIGTGLFAAYPENPDPAHVRAQANLRASLQRVVTEKVTDTLPIQQYDIRLPASLGGGFEERHWRVVNAPVLSGTGELLYITHCVEDATEIVRVGRREQEDRNLQASEILESIAEGFFALDRAWRFTYVNREALNILGRASADLLGVALWDAYPGLIGHELEHGYRRAMDERIAGAMTSFYPDHGRWYEVHTYPAPGGISVYFRDLTEQKQAEAASDQQRRMYEVALSNTPDLVYVFDLDHRFIYANEALLAMWGRPREEAIGRNCLELGYEPWHAEMHGREIEHVVATRMPIRGEVPFSGTQGTRVYDYIFVPVIGSDGTVTAVAGTTRDVTERQQAERAIREQALRLGEADRAKDEFLATLSHELRNPLAPLRSALTLLRMDGGATEGRIASIHAMMERQVDHLVRLVDDLLEMSRISRGALELRKVFVDVAEIVRNAIETSQPLVQAARHTLTVSLPDAPLWLEGDPVRLAQILSNLLSNSAKYTDDGGRIAVTVRQEGSIVAMAVQDNGTGIAAHALPRMFEMFSREDRARGRVQGGLGIGLALARRLAEMHGGSLDAHSEGPGKGSEFVLRLPIAQSPKPAATPGSRDTTAPVGHRILVVDDNRDAAESLGMLLELIGAEVRIANDGRTALDLVESYGPTVLLLDIGMPDMDGYEVARTIRASRPARPPVIVALTGWGQEEDRRRTRAAGFDHHLVKPVDLDALRGLLASLAPTSQLPAVDADS